MKEFLETLDHGTIIIIALFAFLINLGGLAWIVLNQIALEYEVQLNRIFFEGKVEAVIRTLAYILDDGRSKNTTVADK